jgi:hypothetical protein
MTLQNVPTIGKNRQNIPMAETAGGIYRLVRVLVFVRPVSAKGKIQRSSSCLPAQ